MRATDICITFFLHLALALPEIYYSPMKLFLVNIYNQDCVIQSFLWPPRFQRVCVGQVLVIKKKGSNCLLTALFIWPCKRTGTLDFL